MIYVTQARKLMQNYKTKMSHSHKAYMSIKSLTTLYLWGKIKTETV